MTAQRQIELRMLESLSEIPRQDWERLEHDDDNPFVSWSFLEGLERTGCVARGRGWYPCHLTAWDVGEDGETTLFAVAPAYLKGDGMGDFSRDWAFYDAAQHAGGSLYPKMVVCSPFSPVPGRRFLVARDEDREVAVRALVSLAVEICQRNRIASFHVLYHDAEEAEILEDLGLAPRVMVQYHWHNHGYETPDDWLARLKSKRRTQARRERREPARQGIDIRTVRGTELAADPERYAAQAFDLYRTTCEKYMWGGTYLNKEFYELLFDRLRDSVELVLARSGEDVIAGAINLATKSHLFGRYWGCYEERKFLHFNVCLYHSIDECIERGVQVFEGGAGGEHKLMRGFEPAPVYSSHRFFHPELAEMLEPALVQDAKRRELEIERWHREHRQLG